MHPSPTESAQHDLASYNFPHTRPRRLSGIYIHFSRKNAIPSCTFAMRSLGVQNLLVCAGGVFCAMRSCVVVIV
jgi:hypothetical protein